MTMFDESHCTARNNHINNNCNARVSTAGQTACRIAHALFHLDGLANVVDADIRNNSGFLAECCRLIDRELKAHHDSTKLKPPVTEAQKLIEELYCNTADGLSELGDPEWGTTLLDAIQEAKKQVINRILSEPEADDVVPAAKPKRRATDICAELMATLRLETSVLAEEDAEPLAETLTECLPRVFVEAPKLLESLERITRWMREHFGPAADGVNEMLCEAVHLIQHCDGTLDGPFAEFTTQQLRDEIERREPDPMTPVWIDAITDATDGRR